jgi:hypothetical protein
VGICVRLEIEDEFFGGVVVPGAGHALLDLGADGGQRAREKRRERINVAIRASAVAFAAVAVGATQSGIDNDLEHPLARKFSPQIGTVRVVSLDG